jgi:flagellar biosynthesis GTPase FlhF
MLLRRIEAAELQDALAKARKDCGPDALLVETRRVGNRYVVVAAMPEPARGPERSRALAAGAGARPCWQKGFLPLAERAAGFGISRAVLASIERALLGTRVRLDQPGDPALPPLAAKVLKALIRVQDLPLPQWRTIALVGPTGVGKTTTLSKLAARAQRDGERVAIVTLDTWRVGAVEQLRAFADMLGAPFEVAFTPLDLSKALQTHRAADRILIDTSGRSPFDGDALAALAGTLATTRRRHDTLRTALCLPAGTRRADALAGLQAFDPLAPDCVVLTKWDETRVPGEALSLAIERGLSLSHVAIGQRVPDDLVAADAGMLAAAAFGLSDRQVEALL